MYMHRAYMIKEHMYMHNTYMHNVYMHQSRGLYMHDKYAASWIHASYTRVSGSPLVRGPPKLLVENITVDFEIYWPFGSGVPLRPSWHEDVAEGCPEVAYTLSLDKNKAFDITPNVSIENYQISNVLYSDNCTKQLSGCSSVPAVLLYSGLKTT